MPSNKCAAADLPICIRETWTPPFPNTMTAAPLDLLLSTIGLLSYVSNYSRSVAVSNATRKLHSNASTGKCLRLDRGLLNSLAPNRPLQQSFVRRYVTIGRTLFVNR